MMTLQHDKYHSQSSSEQKLLSVIKKDRICRQEMINSGPPIMHFRLCSWYVYPMNLNQSWYFADAEKNSHSEAIQRRCSHTLFLNVIYCRSGKTNMKDYDFLAILRLTINLQRLNSIHCIEFNCIDRRSCYVTLVAMVAKFVDNIKTKT